VYRILLHFICCVVDHLVARRPAVRRARARIPTRHSREVSATELFSDDDKWRMSVDVRMYEKTNKVTRNAIRPPNLYILFWLSFPGSCFFVLAGEAKGERWPMAAPLLGLLPVNPETPGRILKKINTRP
jgi:hypothetical protein